MSNSIEPVVANPYAPAGSPTAPAVAALPHEGEIRVLFARGKSGAGWFYWIAALSAVNTVMTLSGGGGRFALGLGVTFISDFLALRRLNQAAGNMSGLVALIGFDLVVLGSMVLCGRLSQKRILPVYALGMVLYLLDGLLCLKLGGVMMIVIHAFALWHMWSGFAAFRRLNTLERQMQMAGVAQGT